MSTPYIGSKISLISKSESRYEGILYTVDPKESTIALAKVRSFGTENRATETPIPPRDDVYEYIIFKASDIKDLTVCETPQPAPQIYAGLPYDPAIVSVSKQSGMHTMASAAPFPPPDMPGVLSTSSSKVIASVPSSRSETPLNRETSPKTEMGVQTNNAPSNRAPGGGRQNRRGGGSQRGGGGGQQQNSGGQQGQGQGQRQFAQQNLSSGGRTGNRQQTISGSSAGERGDRGQGFQDRGDRGGGFQERGDRSGGFQQFGFQQRDFSDIQNQGAFRGRGGPRRGSGGFYGPMNGPFFRGGFQQPGGGRGNASPFIYRGGYASMRGAPQQQQQQRRPSQSRINNRGADGQPLKFDNDYDFEKANEQFQETLSHLKDEVAKVKIDEPKDKDKDKDKEQKKPNEETSVETKVPVENNVDNADDTGDEDKAPFYDKNKSFFDAISCEALERAEGKNTRLNWRRERELNTETFGQAALRNYQFRRGSGMRGGMGVGRGYRRGGYNSGGRYR